MQRNDQYVLSQIEKGGSNAFLAVMVALLDFVAVNNERHHPDLGEIENHLSDNINSNYK